ncbi:MAG: NAD-glutamate dehydrogenase [Thiohalospira sp.]
MEREPEQPLAAVRRRAEAEEATAGPGFAAFVGACYAGMAAEDLAERSVADLVGAARAHWGLLHRPRRPGERHLRVHDPDPEADGWWSPHTVVELVQMDRPFLVDSLRLVLNRHGLAIHWTVHPVVTVERDADGAVVATGRGEPEAVVRLEVDRRAGTDHAALAAELEAVLATLDAVVDDWRPMVARLEEAAAAVAGAPVAGAEEAAEFLRWLAGDHFTLLGYRSHTLESDADGPHLCVEARSGLGMLRGPEVDRRSSTFDALPRAYREEAARPEPLLIAKSRRRSTIHRPGYLDMIGVRRFDEQGRVIGEWRFLGLFTSNAHHERPHRIPLLREKVAAVMERSGLEPRSHAGKALYNILETLPRDELFQADSDQLLAAARAIVQLQERQRVRLVLRPDRFGRFLAALVHVPREDFDTRLRLAIQSLLTAELGAHGVDVSVWLDDSELARVYLLLHTDPAAFPEPDARALERRLADLARGWGKRLHAELIALHGEARGLALEERYRDAFPASYRDLHRVETAAADIDRMERLAGSGGMATALELGGPGGLRLRLLRTERPFGLSDLLPVLEHLGVRVADQQSHALRPAGGGVIWLQDLGLEGGPAEDASGERADAFREAFQRVWDGEAEDDDFNRLILHAGLDWREADLLRAAHRWLHQTGLPFGPGFTARALAEQGQLARLLVDLFNARFDPALDEPTRGERAGHLGEAIERSLEAVPGADTDRVLRRLLGVIQATVRTNRFRDDVPALALKIDSRRLAELPEPRPAHEIFVHAPHVEGVHLRGGDVARGGIRWSDRHADYRTEVLGLMKTQMVKNAVIVPVGAKGGFVVKGPRPGEAEPVAGEAAYADYIRALLSVTDNLDGEGRTVPPAGVVRHDGDDPYFVVAADKGTATFSDTANAIATEAGFWLGDAFASGGSAGYDHKALGITARGAWESVRRHFRELGRDPETDPVTVVGIGSMNGDVFGNGLLRSRTVQLIGAFTHREIFLDPDPDPEASYRERERLFHAGRGGWSEYDPALISEGGGVWPRSAKTIPLSPRLQERLGVDADELRPEAVVRALLTAPVDLLFNGAVGTFIKAEDEGHEATGDRANDALRVDATALRCAVIGEGGNLGMTQRARVEAARRGVRVFADFIDNAAGVDTSDHEVNVKIAVDGAVAAGELPAAERDTVVGGVAGEVAEQVLTNCRDQAQALGVAGHTAADRLEVHARLARRLERAGYLDRRGWAFPDEAEIADRHRDGEPLAAPELAVLMALARQECQDALAADALCGDPDLDEEVSAYFPDGIVERLPGAGARHRLRNAIAACMVTNQLVNRMGPSFPLRMAEQSGATYPEVARAFLIARRVFDLTGLWAEVEALEGELPAPVIYDLLGALRQLGRRATLWLLRNRPADPPIAATADPLRATVTALAGALDGCIDAAAGQRMAADTAAFTERGVPEGLARRIAGLPYLLPGLDIAELATGHGVEAATVGRLYFRLGSYLGLDWLRDRIAELPAEAFWERMARNALRDDTARLHRMVTQAALETAAGAGDADAILARWTEAHAGPVERLRGRMEELSGGPGDLPRLTVAADAVRRLLRATEGG